MTKASRDIARSIDMALIVRDRTCARPGCGKRLGLEIDHRKVDYRDDGPTELDNLVRLCPDCHALKTFGGWRLEGKPGHWKWIAPAHPKSAQYIARGPQTCGRQGERAANGGQAGVSQATRPGAQRAAAQLRRQAGTVTRRRGPGAR